MREHRRENKKSHGLGDERARTNFGANSNRRAERRTLTTPTHAHDDFLEGMHTSSKIVHQTNGLSARAGG